MLRWDSSCAYLAWPESLKTSRQLTKWLLQLTSILRSRGAGKRGVLDQLKRKKGKLNIQRFKGQGEINPMQLRETALDPNTRRLVQLFIDDEDDRRNWLQEKGDMVDLEA